VIIAILLFAFLLVGLVIGTKTKTIGELTADIPQSPAPNYHYIPPKEREYWGEAFHNIGAKLCECDTCIAGRVPKYLGKTNHIGIAAAAYGYGIVYKEPMINPKGARDMGTEEWRDRNGN